MEHKGLRELRGREMSLRGEEVRGCFFCGWGSNTKSGPYGKSRQTGAVGGRPNPSEGRKVGVCRGADRGTSEPRLRAEMQTSLGNSLGNQLPWKV